MGMMAESDDDDHRMSMVTFVTAMIYHSRHLSLGNVVYYCHVVIGHPTSLFK